MLRIDPRLPILWRSPRDVQIGFATALTLLTNVSDAEERLIATLHAGASEVTLTATARHLKIPESEVTALMDLVRPALEPTPPPRKRVAVTGNGLGAAWIRRALEDEVDIVAFEEDSPPDVVVSSSAMVASPADMARLLGRDIPHLPVVWMDTGCDVGPFVIPGRTPCWYCAEAARCTEDPARRALLTQVAGRPAASESQTTCMEVAARVVRWITTETTNDLVTPGPGTVLRWDAPTGAWSSRVFKMFADCSCQSLPRNESDLEASAMIQNPVTTTKPGLVERA